LKRANEANYSTLDELSYGERCSAILGIALLSKGKPLIIDQPEDELDHEFITKDIVSGIKSIKGERQIIVASHNPNIPALGDAELVIRVVKQPGKARCTILEEGSLEEESITRHVLELDGGPDAFDLRRRKYMMN
jgi:ABC-type lipoprotein export system ATPase subunit